MTPDIERLKAEFEKIRSETPDPGDWRVLRQDTHGVKYPHCEEVSQDYAERYTAALAAMIGDHHQTVWFEKMPGPNAQP